MCECESKILRKSDVPERWQLSTKIGGLDSGSFNIVRFHFQNAVDDIINILLAKAFVKQNIEGALPKSNSLVSI